MKTGILKTGAAERRELILNGSIVRTLMMLSFPTLMMSVVQSLMPLSDGLFINNVAVRWWPAPLPTASRS